MTVVEKKRLVELLRGSFEKVKDALEGVDPEMQVNPETDWRVRDIVGHLAAWDREVTKSILSYLGGSEYSIPEYSEDRFNDNELRKYRLISCEDVFAHWEGARREFIQAVEDMPDNRFGEEMLYPWGNERGTVTRLVEYLAEHDGDHRIELEQSFNG